MLNNLVSPFYLYVCTYRTKESQTRSDHATSVPKPAMFMAGLRGKDIKPQKVELTLDVATHNNIHS